MEHSRNRTGHDVRCNEEVLYKMIKGFLYSDEDLAMALEVYRCSILFMSVVHRFYSVR